MLVPFSWLKKYVETNSSPSEIAHLLTMAGVEIDEIKSIGDNLDSNLKNTQMLIAYLLLTPKLMRVKNYL